MAFDYLLCHCLIPDQTSHHESGKRVSIRRESGETILFFAPDRQAVRELTRQQFNVSQFCDLIVFYRGRPGMAILFVELKGTDVDDAIKQLESAVGAVHRHSTFSKADTKLIAIIVSSASSLEPVKKAQKKFSDQWGVILKQKTQKSGALDLREYLDACW